MFVSQVFKKPDGSCHMQPEKKRKDYESRRHFLMTSRVLYLAAQVHPAMHGLSFFQPLFPLDALTVKLGV